MQVPQHDDFRAPERRGDLRVEISKYVQFCGKGISFVEVVLVFAAPEEGLASGNHFQPFYIDVFFL